MNDNEKKIITKEGLRKKAKDVNLGNWVEYNYNSDCILDKLDNSDLLTFQTYEFGYYNIDDMIKELQNAKKQIEKLKGYALDKNIYNCSWNKAYEHMKKGNIVQYNDHYYKIIDNFLCCSVTSCGIYVKDDLINFNMVDSNEWVLIND